MQRSVSCYISFGWRRHTSQSTSEPSQVGCKNLASIDRPKVRDSGASRSPLCCISACSVLFAESSGRPLGHHPLSVGNNVCSLPLVSVPDSATG